MIKYYSLNLIFQYASSVDIATDYGLDGSGIESRWGEFFRPSTPVVEPTQPPVQWLPALSRGKVRPGRAADHSPLLVPWSWKSRAIPLPTLWAITGPVTGTLYLIFQYAVRTRQKVQFTRYNGQSVKTYRRTSAVLF